jgi:hypothetical protein
MICFCSPNNLCLSLILSLSKNTERKERESVGGVCKSKLVVVVSLSSPLSHFLLHFLYIIIIIIII